MKFTVEKPKTWKGLSYPLKTSILKDAIEKAELDSTFHLKYWTPKHHDESYNILECTFWPAKDNIPYDRFYIRAGVVQSQDKRLVEDYLETDVIPKLIEFMRNKILLHDNSTQLKQDSYFKAVFSNGKILMNE